MSTTLILKMFHGSLAPTMALLQEEFIHLIMISGVVVVQLFFAALREV